ncbi:gamma-glutamylcyclotransferase (plasmid) [Nonomuraea sp. NBC_00507]|uniref:gamma-glutamylcyclotransferase family protein n=1 Tax=Nonomuraea sp. NBC_00507 TaxID=2976002 RepID=UPI002E170A32
MERLPFFVYGTLRPGQGNHRLFEGRISAEYDGARAPGFVLYANGLPYVRASGDVADEVIGTLVIPEPETYPQLLRRLDALEGVRPNGAGLYNRKVCLAHYLTQPEGDWQETRAWIYEGGSTYFTYAEHLRVPSGDWLRTRAA